MTIVEYKISTYPSRFLGYQAKKQDTGKITLYVSSMYQEAGNHDDFVELLIDIMVCERICLERAFQKIRMRNRCKEFTWKSPGSMIATGIFAEIFKNIPELQMPCKMGFMSIIMQTKWN